MTTSKQSGSFLKKFSWVSIFQLVNSASAFLINIFVARHIGPSDFGNFYFFVSTALVSTFLFDFGLSRTLLRYSAHHEARGEKVAKLSYYAAVLSVKSLLGVAVLVIGSAASWFWGGELRFELMLGLLTGFVISFSQYFASVAQTEEDYKTYNIILSFNTIRLLGVACLIVLGLVHIQALYAIFILTPVLLLTYPTIKLGKDLAQTKTIPEKHFYQKLFQFGKWMLLLAILETVTQRLDVILVRWLLDAEQAGYYSGALAFFGIVYMLPAYSAILVYPKFVKAVSKNNDEAVNYFYKISTDLMAIIAIPMALGLYAVAPDLIQNVIGEKFGASQPLFIFMALYSMVLGCHLNSGTIFFAKDKPQWSVMVVAATFLTNIIVNLILIPSMGIKGAGIAICLSIGVSLVLSWGILGKQYKLFPNFSNIIIYLIAAGFMVGIVRLFPVQGWILLILKIGAGAIGYGSVILLVSRFKKNIIPKTRHEFEGV